MEVQEARGAETDRVLDGDQHDADPEEHEQPRPPLDEHPGVGSEPHRREEHQEERVLQGQVEAQLHAQQAVDQGEEQRHQAAANDGGRDVEAPEDGHPGHQEPAQEEHHHGDEQRGDEVELYGSHVPLPPDGDFGALS
jgi:hypothetical protein